MSKVGVASLHPLGLTAAPKAAIPERSAGESRVGDPSDHVVLSGAKPRPSRSKAPSKLTGLGAKVFAAAMTVGGAYAGWTLHQSAMPRLAASLVTALSGYIFSDFALKAVTQGHASER